MPPASTVLTVCEMETLVPGTVTVAEFVAIGLLTAVAVIFTARSPAGYVLGAV